MKILPGQKFSEFFQRLRSGEFLTPREVYAGSRAHFAGEAVAAAERWDAIPEPDGWSAPERLKAPGQFTTNSFVKNSWRADWQRVDRRLIIWSAVFCELARKRDIPLYVFSAYRTKAEQELLLKRGVTRAAYPRSAHNIGEAVDIVHASFHWNLNSQEWDLLHVIGLQALKTLNSRLKVADHLHLTWGGHFKSLYDPAHWEITDFRSRIDSFDFTEGPPRRMTPRFILNDAAFRL